MISRVRTGRLVLVLVTIAACAMPLSGRGAEVPDVDLPGAPAAAGGAIASDNVKFVMNIPDLVAVGARRIGDTLYVTTAQGIRIYDVSTGLPVLMGAADLPHLQNEDVDTNGKVLLVAADHFAGVNNTLYVFDVSNGHVPILASVIRNIPMAHTATCIQNCRYAWLGGGNGEIGVVDLTIPTAAKYLGDFRAPGSVHDVQVDAQGIAWVSSSGGLFAYKQSAYPMRPTLLAYGLYFHNHFIIHNSLRPYAKSWKPASTYGAPMQDGELTLVTEENWIGLKPNGVDLGNNECRDDGRFQTGQYRKVGTGWGQVNFLDDFHVGQGTQGEFTGSKQGRPVATCSAHYFGYSNRVAAVAWYEQGTRFLDVSKPTNIRQIGYYMPLNGMAWNAMYVGPYVYIFDATRGLDIVRLDTSAGNATRLAPFLNPLRSPDVTPDRRFGYACRIMGASV
jgi:hypothetical protein